MSAPAPVPATPPRPPRRVARILLLQLALLVVVLLAVEGAYRVVLAARGSPWSAEAGRAEVGAAREALFKVDWRAPEEEDRTDAKPVEERAEIILHPYFGFDIAAGQDDYVDMARLLRREDPEAVFDVVVVGGSVACQLVQYSQRKLIAALQKDPRLREKPVRIHLLGRGGYKQPQQLFIVSYALALGWRPEAVINIDGFNELALSNYNAQHGAHPFHPSLPHWAHLAKGRQASPAVEALGARMYLAREGAAAWCERIERWGLLRSAVLGRLALARLAAARSRYAALYGEYVEAAGAEGGLTVSGPPYRKEVPAVLRTAVTSWADCSRSLAAICAAHGILYLHVLQPTLHDKGSKPLSAKELETGRADRTWVRACREGYPKLREAGLALAAQGVHFCDASMIFAEVEDDLYYDACHFGKRGNDLFAERVGAELVRLLP